MGWLFGGGKSRSHTEVLHPAWSTCSGCKHLSRAGAPSSTANCMLSADDAYEEVCDQYGEDTQFSYVILDFYFYADYTIYACCGDAAPAGTRVARITHDGERRRGIHHVLLASHRLC